MTSEAAFDRYLELLRPIEQEIARAVQCADPMVSRKLIAEHVAALKTRIEFDRAVLASESHVESDEVIARRKRRMLALFDPAAAAANNASGAAEVVEDITTMRSDAFLKLLGERDMEIARLQCKIAVVKERNDMLVKNIDMLLSEGENNNDDTDDDGD
jgi:hypothetical protein